MNACDQEGDGYLDQQKLYKIVKLGLTKEENSIVKKNSNFLEMKIKKLIELINPPKVNDIKEYPPPYTPNL